MLDLKTQLHTLSGVAVKQVRCGSFAGLCSFFFLFFFLSVCCCWLECVLLAGVCVVGGSVFCCWHLLVLFLVGVCFVVDWSVCCA